MCIYLFEHAFKACNNPLPNKIDLENRSKSCKILKEQYFATFGERLKTEKTLRLLTNTCDYPNNVTSCRRAFAFVTVDGERS